MAESFPVRVDWLAHAVLASIAGGMSALVLRFAREDALLTVVAWVLAVSMMLLVMAALYRSLFPTRYRITSSGVERCGRSPKLVVPFEEVSAVEELSVLGWKAFRVQIRNRADFHFEKRAMRRADYAALVQQVTEATKPFRTL